MSADFDALYSPIGRPSIPPERLLRALLLQAFYIVRSERQLMEQIDYNLLFRWFVGLSVDDPVWDATVFMQESGPAARRRYGAEVPRRGAGRCPGQGLLSSEHFSVDGTLMEAWASPRASAPRTARTSRPDRGATASATFAVRSARTTRTRRPLTPMPGGSAREGARRLTHWPISSKSLPLTPNGAFAQRWEACPPRVNQRRSATRDQRQSRPTRS